MSLPSVKPLDSNDTSQDASNNTNNANNSSNGSSNDQTSQLSSQAASGVNQSQTANGQTLATGMQSSYPQQNQQQPQGQQDVNDPYRYSQQSIPPQAQQARGVASQQAQAQQAQQQQAQAQQQQAQQQQAQQAQQQQYYYPYQPVYSQQYQSQYPYYQSTSNPIGSAQTTQMNAAAAAAAAANGTYGPYDYSRFAQNFMPVYPNNTGMTGAAGATGTANSSTAAVLPNGLPPNAAGQASLVAGVGNPQQLQSTTPSALGQVQPLGSRPRVTTTMWEDEKTLCYQVDANGVSVVRRADNNMINGTKLLNVAHMTRGRRDGILKSEKIREVVKIGSMHLKGVWIPFERALAMAQREGIVDLLYPLFVRDIKQVIQQGSTTSQPQTTPISATAGAQWGYQQPQQPIGYAQQSTQQQQQAQAQQQQTQAQQQQTQQAQQAQQAQQQQTASQQQQQTQQQQQSQQQQQAATAAAAQQQPHQTPQQQHQAQQQTPQQQQLANQHQHQPSQQSSDSSNTNSNANQSQVAGSKVSPYLTPNSLTSTALVEQKPANQSTSSSLQQQQQQQQSAQQQSTAQNNYSMPASTATGMPQQQQNYYGSAGVSGYPYYPQYQYAYGASANSSGSTTTAAASTTNGINQASLPNSNSASLGNTNNSITAAQAAATGGGYQYPQYNSYGYVPQFQSAQYEDKDK